VGEGSSVIKLLGGLGLGLGVYVGLMWLLKMPEIIEMLDILMTKIEK